MSYEFKGIVMLSDSETSSLCLFAIDDEEDSSLRKRNDRIY